MSDGEGLNPSPCFNPRSPRGERPGPVGRGSAGSVFQSALPARGATRSCWTRECWQRVSIRAPRAGSDADRARAPGPCRGFNPRSPRGERRAAHDGSTPQRRFQSALPARGATVVEACRDYIESVSIRAPRAGSDLARAMIDIEPHHGFNPRSPRGERREEGGTASCLFQVSIRAPRAGSDVRRWICGFWSSCFNPRSPRGERPSFTRSGQSSSMFQSALPARGAT